MVFQTSAILMAILLLLIQFRVQNVIKRCIIKQLVCFFERKFHADLYIRDIGINLKLYDVKISKKSVVIDVAEIAIGLGGLIKLLLRKFFANIVHAKQNKDEEFDNENLIHLFNTYFLVSTLHIKNMSIALTNSLLPQALVYANAKQLYISRKTCSVEVMLSNASVTIMHNNTLKPRSNQHVSDNKEEVILLSSDALLDVGIYQSMIGVDLKLEKLYVNGDSKFYKYFDIYSYNLYWMMTTEIKNWTNKKKLVQTKNVSVVEKLLNKINIKGRLNFSRVSTVITFIDTKFDVNVQGISIILNQECIKYLQCPTVHIDNISIALTNLQLPQTSVWAIAKRLDLNGRNCLKTCTATINVGLSETSIRLMHRTQVPKRNEHVFDNKEVLSLLSAILHAKIDQNMLIADLKLDKLYVNGDPRFYKYFDIYFHKLYLMMMQIKNCSNKNNLVQTRNVGIVKKLLNKTIIKTHLSFSRVTAAVVLIDKKSYVHIESAKLDYNNYWVFGINRFSWTLRNPFELYNVIRGTDCSDDFLFIDSISFDVDTQNIIPKRVIFDLKKVQIEWSHELYDYICRIYVLFQVFKLGYLHSFINFITESNSIPSELIVTDCSLFVPTHNKQYLTLNIHKIVMGGDDKCKSMDLRKIRISVEKSMDKVYILKRIEVFENNIVYIDECFATYGYNTSQINLNLFHKVIVRYSIGLHSQLCKFREKFHKLFNNINSDTNVNYCITIYGASDFYFEMYGKFLCKISLVHLAVMQKETISLMSNRPVIMFLRNKQIYRFEKLNYSCFEATPVMKALRLAKTPLQLYSKILDLIF
ncbi:hypothetical protein FQR65_LT11372 [Abscondita terminalis]|nr:hypothetical protein FQR65_LT11372 [Abscondita terminalis]